MQKDGGRDALGKRPRLKQLMAATEAREDAEEQQVRAAHEARNAGATWAEIADASSKGSAAAAASYFGDSMDDRSAKRASARERATRR